MDFLTEIREFLSHEAWLYSVIRIALIAVLAFAGYRILKASVNRFKDLLIKRSNHVEAEKRANTLAQVVNVLGAVLIFSVAGMMILSEVGIDLKPIIAAAGIGGVAIGFGAQNLVKDIISGFFMLAENQVRVGDIVRIGNSAGVVENISLRVLMLRDLNGNLHVIQHGSIDKVENMSHTFAYCLIDTGVSYRENVYEVIKVIKQVGEELKDDPEIGPHILEPLDIWGLERFEDSAVVIRSRFKTAPAKQWVVLRAMNIRLKARFDELGIEIPFPHQTLYFGVPKTGRNVLSIQTDVSREE